MLIFFVLPDLQKDFKFGMFCFLTSTELSASTSRDFSTFSTTCHVILIHRHTLPFCLLLCRAFFSLTTSLYLHIHFILSSSYWLLIIFGRLEFRDKLFLFDDPWSYSRYRDSRLLDHLLLISYIRYMHSSWFTELSIFYFFPIDF